SVGSIIIGMVCVVFFFFFQAEDVLRDKVVTGVQTCALPISGCADFPLPVLHGRASLAVVQMALSVTRRQRKTRGRTSAFVSILRSEERRVGKECRSWWSPYQ